MPLLGAFSAFLWPTIAGAMYSGVRMNIAETPRPVLSIRREQESRNDLRNLDFFAPIDYTHRYVNAAASVSALDTIHMYRVCAVCPRRNALAACGATTIPTGPVSTLSLTRKRLPGSRMGHPSRRSCAHHSCRVLGDSVCSGPSNGHRNARGDKRAVFVTVD